MKVKTLIDLLKMCNPEDVVVIAIDDKEGSELCMVTSDRFKKDGSWSGTLGLRKLTDIDIDYGLTEDDVLHQGQDCVALWSELVR